MTAIICQAISDARDTFVMEHNVVPNVLLITQRTKKLMQAELANPDNREYFSLKFTRLITVADGELHGEFAFVRASSHYI